MSLSDQDVRRVAHLARLTVSPAEIAAWGASLSRILDLIERMNAVDTSGVEPMAHPRDVALRLRPDGVSEVDVRERLQRIAPAVEAGLYLVPKVIE
jgi:aspartyl-tRNA(Asn)/glutamyl-tRNA(Gln) amidotransferase subunit C